MDADCLPAHFLQPPPPAAAPADRRLPPVGSRQRRPDFSGRRQTRARATTQRTFAYLLLPYSPRVGGVKNVEALACGMQACRHSLTLTRAQSNASVAIGTEMHWRLECYFSRGDGADRRIYLHFGGEV